MLWSERGSCKHQVVTIIEMIKYIICFDEDMDG